ncbi:MAG: AAC(3) family N-acetyltransferase [Verrucomicrobia bacterium]|nr:AAC(3) family N-acetyltransferase [Verrucomicrobiota bacterium]MBU1734140.1 AAC(3) family N-acetyltransferase [Verrucomicrobiota bacterium]MBU1855390.1 AAC(3) family N-acetyltransferase [Verrucomicrobiota bacterium]
MEDAQRVTKDMIKKCLVALGIVEGDLVFFHSSLKSIGHVEGGADAVIDAFLETLGKSGTLVLPALCAYDCKTGADWDKISREEIENAWDIKTTPTFTGLIPETLRKRVGTIRSDNPTHSVTAVGRYASEITKDHKKAHGGEWAANRPKWASRGAFGENSPWDKLYTLDAKYMLIGVDFNSCTMLHHVQMVLLEKYLRKIDGNAPWPIFDFRQIGRKLEALGIVRFGKIGCAVTRLMSCRSLVDMAIKVLRP